MDLNIDKNTLIRRFVSSCQQISLLAINSKLMSQISEIVTKDSETDYKVIDLCDDITPLKPFLEIIASNNPSEQDIRKSAYSLQENTFVSYLKNGIVEKRSDVVIQSEINYEKKRIRKTVIELLKKFNNQNYIFLNAQFLGTESLDIIKEIPETDFSTKFIFCFDITASNKSFNEVRKFLDDSGNKDFYLSLTDFDYDDDESLSKSSARKFKIDSAKFNFDEIYNSIKNNVYFLSCQQARFLCDVVEKYSHTLQLSDEQEKKLFLVIGLSYFYSSMFEKAVLYFTRILETNVDSEETACALYYLSQCFYVKKNFVAAKKYLNIFFNKKSITKENSFYPLCLMTEYLINDGSNVQNTIFQYKTTLETLKHTNLTNCYITVGTLIPWNILIIPEYKSFIENQIEQSYILAQQIDNQYAVALACQWRAVVFSSYGQKEQALEWYEESDRIRTEIGDNETILVSRNGISYEALTSANYPLAYDIVNEVIQNLYDVDDCSKIIDCLKNASLAAFYSRNYDFADKLFDTILVFLGLFSYQKSPLNSFLPTNEDVLMYKSLIAIDKGDFVHPKINYFRLIKKLSSLTYTDKPMINLLKAILNLEDNKIDDAIDAINEGISEIDKLSGFEVHKTCFMLYEFSIMLSRFGYQEESEYFLQQGFELAKLNNFSYYTLDKDEITLTDYFENLQMLPKLKISLHFLNERAEKELLFSKLHQRLSDYQFLNNVKSISLQFDLATYAKNILSLFFDYSMASTIELVVFEDDKVRSICKYSKTNEEIDTQIWQSLFLRHGKNSSGHLIYESDFNLYFCLSTQFGSNWGLIIIDNDKTLSTEVVNALDIAISAVYSEIIIFKQNSDLQFYSSTDQLSLLKNRHSLQDYMRDRSKVIEDYYKQNDKVLRETIVFIDLDNFKYYNDTFGHELGDTFIKKFAELIKGVFRRDDFIARFGGDEFIIILPEVTNEIAKKITSKIYDKLQEQEYFIPYVKEFMKGKDVEIPESLRLGFSLGFCCNTDVEKPYDLSDVLAKADKAMYHSKTHGKGFVTDWKDICNE